MTDKTRKCCSQWATPVSLRIEWVACGINLIITRSSEACLLASIQVASNALSQVSEAKNAVVHTQVHLGKPHGHDGYGLEVEIQVEGVSQELLDAGHEVCTPGKDVDNIVDWGWCRHVRIAER